MCYIDIIIEIVSLVISFYIIPKLVSRKTTRIYDITGQFTPNGLLGNQDRTKNEWKEIGVDYKDIKKKNKEFIKGL